MASDHDTSEIVIPQGLEADPGKSFDPGKTWIASFLEQNIGNIFGEKSTVELNEWLDSVEAAADEERASGLSPVPDLAAMPSPYQLRQVVGEGGFGVVWEAIQTSLGRTIAVKKLRENFEKKKRHSSYVARHMELSFRHEALTTGSLEHPNIVPVYDLGLDETGRPMIAMKLVRGDQWDDVIERDFPQKTVQEFLAKHLIILVDVCQAVAFSHSRGVVHRDIKPSQVMLGEFGEVLLMDWGLSLVYDLDLARQQGHRLAQTDFTPWSPRATSPAGTPSFMAPEQTLETPKYVGPWTDVYLLGGSLYFLLTGAAPHEQETAEKTFEHASAGVVTPPEERNRDRDIPPELSRLAMRALTRNYRKRPTAKEMIKGLRDYLTGATNRREAREIMDEVRELSEQSFHDFSDYARLTDCLTMLDRALILSPMNMEAIQLRQDVLIQFTRIALAAKDYKLARVQAERMMEGPERHHLIEEIAHLEQKQRAEQINLEKSFERAKRMHEMAEEAQRELEGLMASMLSELRNNLQDPKEARMLLGMAKRCMVYYRTFASRGGTGPGVLQRIHALMSIGRIFSSQGLGSDALEALHMAQELAEAYSTRHPTDAEAEQLLLEIKELMLRMLQSVQRDQSSSGIDLGAVNKTPKPIED